MTPTAPTHPRLPPCAADELLANVACDGGDGDALHRTFQRHGLVIVRGFLTAAEVAETLAHIDRVVDALPGRIASGAVPASHVQYDDVQVPATLKQIQQLWKKDPFFERLMARLQGVAEATFGEGAAPQNMQFFSKPPRSAYAGARLASSQPTPPHQDAHYFMLETPASAATLWVALDRVDEENGCLRYLPTRGASASEQPLRPHDYSGIVGFSQAITDWSADDERREVAVRARPGDLIVHQSLMVHRADANRSGERQRRAVGAIFYADSHRVDRARWEARQAEIATRAALLEGQDGA